MRVSIERCVTGPLADEIIATHHLLFDEVDSNAIQIQSIPDEMLRGLLAHPDLLAVTAWDDNEQAVGSMLLTPNLDIVPWINSRFIRTRYQNLDASAVWYAPLIQLHPDHQDIGLAQAMTEVVGWVIIAHGASHVIMDCCSWDIETYGIQEWTANVARKFGEVDVEEIDAQRYFALSYLSVSTIDLGEMTSSGISVDRTIPSPKSTMPEQIHI